MRREVSGQVVQKPQGHRAELTILQHDDQVAEWIRLTDLQSSGLRTIETKRADGRGHRPEGGIRAAAREIGVKKTDEKVKDLNSAGVRPKSKDNPRGSGRACRRAVATGIKQQFRIR